MNETESGHTGHKNRERESSRAKKKLFNAPIETSESLVYASILAILANISIPGTAPTPAQRGKKRKSFWESNSRSSSSGVIYFAKGESIEAGNVPL